MRKLFTVITVLLLTITPLAQYPRKISNKVIGSDAKNLLFTTTGTDFNRTTTLSTPVSTADVIPQSYVNIPLERHNTLERQPGKVKDVDGNLYPTTNIGTQVWMGENLKTTRYKDGTQIPLVTDNTAWSNLTTPGYCWYKNNESVNLSKWERSTLIKSTFKDTYGALYNWYSVNTGKLCPAGWHVPTDAELNTLINYLGGTTVAGGKLKESGTLYWITPNTGATNETGFTALPGGQRSVNGNFGGAKAYGNWWSSTGHSSSAAIYLGINFLVSSGNIGSTFKLYGFSVRCIKD